MAKLNVQFSEKQANALAEMGNAMNTTKTGVIRYAMSIYQLTNSERKAGHRLAVVRDGKIIKEIVGLWNVR